MATLIDRVYQIELPVEVQTMLASFEVITVPINVKQFSGTFQCLGMSSYMNVLTMWIFFPMVVIGIACLAVAGQLYRRGLLFRSLRYYLYECLPPTLIVLFLAYPTVTNVAFEAFTCHDFESTDGVTRRYLIADVRVDCESPEYTDLLTLAWVAMLLYPIGIILFCYALLNFAREAIIQGRSTTYTRALAFLHEVPIGATRTRRPNPDAPPVPSAPPTPLRRARVGRTSSPTSSGGRLRR